MSIYGQLSYRDVCNFLLGKNEATQLTELEKDIPIFGIYTFMQNNYNPDFIYPEEINLTFSETEAILEKYLSGNFSQTDAGKLAKAILNSEQSFKKLSYFIEQHANIIADADTKTVYAEALTDNDIFSLLFQSKKRKIDFDFHFNRKRIIAGVVAIASLFFIILSIPDSRDNNLAELYNYDENVPLDYDESAFRGNDWQNKINDAEYNLFRLQFNKGMSEYLAQEYGSAIKEWQGLEKTIEEFASSPFLSDKERHDYYLYNAVCRIAFILSDTENFNEQDRKKILNTSINLFEKLVPDNDAKKYFFALALGLNDKKSKALEILNSITADSEYYSKKVILEERLRQ